MKAYFENRNRGWILSLLGAVCALYLPFWGNPIFFDDVNFFIGGVSRIYGHTGYHLDLRWLPYATLAWTELITGSAVTQLFHLGNLVIHATTVILLFNFLRQLAGSMFPEQPRVVLWGAWAGALVFAVHPVAVYAAGYIIQRSILMATMFALVTQITFVRGLLTGRAVWFLGSALAYFLAVFSKEHSVMVPVLLVAEMLLLRGRISAGRRALATVFTAYLFIGVMVILRQKGVFGLPYEAMATALFGQEGISASGPALHLLSMLTQSGLYFKYLLLWLVPDPAWMSIDMREPFVSSFGMWQGWLGAAAFIAYGVIAVRLLLRGGSRGLLGLAMLYPWLQFILEFSTIRVQEPFVLYRSYLWMPGAMLVFPVLARKWHGKTALFAVVGLSALLVAASANRLWVMADTVRLWNDAVRLLPDNNAPGADRIYYNRGQAYMEHKNLEASVADFRHVVALRPKLPPPHYELGMALLKLGRYQEAGAEFDTVTSLDPKYALGYFGKGLVFFAQHRGEEAIAQMKKGCKLGYWVACWVSTAPSGKKGHVSGTVKQESVH